MTKQLVKPDVSMNVVLYASVGKLVNVAVENDLEHVRQGREQNKGARHSLVLGGALHENGSLLGIMF